MMSMNGAYSATTQRRLSLLASKLRRERASEAIKKRGNVLLVLALLDVLTIVACGSYYVWRYRHRGRDQDQNQDQDPDNQSKYIANPFDFYEGTLDVVFISVVRFICLRVPFWRGGSGWKLHVVGAFASLLSVIHASFKCHFGLTINGNGNGNDKDNDHTSARLQLHDEGLYSVVASIVFPCLEFVVVIGIIHSLYKLKRQFTPTGLGMNRPREEWSQDDRSHGERVQGEDENAAYVNMDADVEEADVMDMPLPNLEDCVFTEEELREIIKQFHEEDEMGNSIKEEGSGIFDSKSDRQQQEKYRGTGPSFWRVISLAWPERWLLIVGTVALAVSSTTQMITPALMGQLIANIGDEHNEEKLNETVVLMVVVFIISSLFSMLRGYLFTLAGERLVARFRARLFDALVHFEVAFFDETQTGELQSRLSNDTTVIQNAATTNISMGLRFLAQAVVGLIIIFYISYKLTLIMLSVVPLLAISAQLYGSYIGKISKAYQESLAKASETAEECFGNIRTVRSFSKEAFEVRRYRARIATSYYYGKTRAFAYGVFIGGIGLGAQLAICLVLWYGGRLVVRETGDLTAAELTSFLLYTIYLAAALAGLSGLFSDLMNAVGASERMFALLDREPAMDTRADGQEGKIVPPEKTHVHQDDAGSYTASSPTTTGNGSIALSLQESRTASSNASSSDAPAIEFRDVSFSYPTRRETKVLDSVSFKCWPGTITALVGTSGAGKSTIVSLLERFYDPNEGTVYIDGVPVPDLSFTWIHRNVAVVAQEPQLFACSIGENIRYGLHRSVDISEIEEAAKKANAFDFVKGFPEGFDTLVGERGVQLSGGQKQRVAIARALLVNPKILLLDEATSALDAESEHLVQEALDRLMRNRTTICIAHRLSTVSTAHNILVMQGGKVVERGTHNELLSKPEGMYHALVKRQIHGT